MSYRHAVRSDTAGSLEEAATGRNEWNRAQPAEPSTSTADIPEVRRNFVKMKCTGYSDVVDVVCAITPGEETEKSADTHDQYDRRICNLVCSGVLTGDCYIV